MKLSAFDISRGCVTYRADFTITFKISRTFPFSGKTTTDRGIEIHKSPNT